MNMPVAKTPSHCYDKIYSTVNCCGSLHSCLVASLARQWTMEDEEELEREQRRKTRDPSVSGEPEEDEGQVSARSPGGSRRSEETSLLVLWMPISRVWLSSWWRVRIPSGAEW